MPGIDTLNASEFKAKCLDLLDQGMTAGSAASS